MREPIQQPRRHTPLKYFCGRPNQPPPACDPTSPFDEVCHCLAQTGHGCFSYDVPPPEQTTGSEKPKALSKHILASLETVECNHTEP